MTLELVRSTGYGQSAGPKQGRGARTKFTVYGEEMLQKQVSSSGKSGRVYVPLTWLGKSVKIVRLD